MLMDNLGENVIQRWASRKFWDFLIRHHCFSFRSLSFLPLTCLFLGLCRVFMVLPWVIICRKLQLEWRLFRMTNGKLADEKIHGETEISAMKGPHMGANLVLTLPYPVLILQSCGACTDFLCATWQLVQSNCFSGFEYLMALWGSFASFLISCKSYAFKCSGKN